MSRTFTGAYGILTTPFREDGAVNISQVEKQAALLCASDLAGIVISGSTSEFPFLTLEENKKLLTICTQAATGRKQVIFGATAPDESMALKYLEHAAVSGADGVLVAPPYYFTQSSENVIQFYRNLSAAGIGVPIIMYQIPAFTAAIPLSGMQELMLLPDIAGIKNSSADIKEIMHQLDLRDRYADGFSVLTGTDDALLPCLAAGCDGSFTALAGILPDAVVALYRCAVNGQWDNARLRQKELLALTRMADSLPFPVGYKLLAEAGGIITTSYRQSLTKSQKQDMQTLLLEMRGQLEAIAAGKEKQNEGGSMDWVWDDNAG